MATQNYEELVKRAKRGDEAALEEIYSSCYAFVVFVCNEYCNSKEDAEEVAQDTFVQAFRKIDQLERADMLLSWLKKIAVNKCYRKYDSTKKHEDNVVYVEDFASVSAEIEELNKDFLPTDFYEDSETRKELLSAVAALPETQRKMVHLYYYVGMNTTEISKLHNCTGGYVRKTLFNARNVLKEKMHDRDMRSVKLAPLGALFVAEEATFVASYVAANATTISTTAATVVGTALKQAAVAAKIATCGYIAACVLTTGLIATGIYHAVQATEYEDIEINNQIEVTAIYEHTTPEPYESGVPYYHDIAEAEVYVYNYEEIDESNASVGVQNITNQQQDLEQVQVYEPEVYIEETLPEEEPEPVIDRTAEILAALANANNNARVNEIIRQYGFSSRVRAQSSLGVVFRFYYTNEGSGDILIGVREFEDEWHMRFTHFNGDVINMQTPDLTIWLQATM